MCMAPFNQENRSESIHEAKAREPTGHRGLDISVGIFFNFVELTCCKNCIYLVLSAFVRKLQEQGCK